MIGFSIDPITRRVSAEFVEKFRELPVANVSDCMWRLTGGGPRLRPYHGGGVMSGPASTGRTSQPVNATSAIRPSHRMASMLRQ